MPASTATRESDLELNPDAEARAYACDSCGSTAVPAPFVDVAGQDNRGYRLVRCQRCELVSVWPPPSPEFLNDFYSENYEGRIKSNIIDWNVDPIASNLPAIEDGYKKLDAILKYAGTGAWPRLLDVGSGHGFFLYAARQRGFDASGIDIDRDAIRFATRRLEVPTLEHSLSELSSVPNTFDMLTAWQVLEHVRDPGEMARQAFTKLAPGGLFCGSVPNLGGIGARIQGRKWYMLIPPEHLNYFTETSMRHWLRHAGFEPLFVGTIPLYASPYFSFGVRACLMRWGRNKGPAVERACLALHRMFTLIKRHGLYKIANFLVMKLNLGGNSLFFVGRKPRASSADNQTTYPHAA